MTGQRRLAGLCRHVHPTDHQWRPRLRPVAAAGSDRTFRIGVVAFIHETNTFAAEQNDTMESVRITRKESMLHGLHPKTFIGGFREVMEQQQYQQIELVPGVAIGFSKGGLISAAVFKECQREIIGALKGMGELDGVFFSMHGAAVAEAPYTDAEGILIREARQLLGTLPMVATYDFHAISSRWEVEEGAVPFPHDTNPHIDAYEQGVEAARCMVKMLDGSWSPLTRRLFVPIIGRE